MCGIVGWCIEIIFTSMGCAKNKNSKLEGHTSLWMFPIYGAAACIYPAYRHLQKLPTALRAALYSAGILSFEYCSGSLLKKINSCPWDYSGKPTNINGLIRLDYAPLWAITGLIFEQILLRENNAR